MPFSIRPYHRSLVPVVGCYVSACVSGNWLSKLRHAFALSALVCVLMLTACVSRPPISRDEWLSMTNRIYEGVTKEQTLTAAERLLRLADGNDFMIAHNDDGFIATRQWTVYLVLAAAIGTDSWVVRAVENGHGETRVSVSVSTQAGGIGAVATGSNTAAPLTMPAMGASVNGTAAYDVFWARMDYLLGRRQLWMDCRVTDGRVAKGLVWGDNSALCNVFNIKDDVPEGAMIHESESPEIEKKKREEQLRQNSY